METKYFLLSYTYYTYCQGTRDRNFGYQLVKIPLDADFFTAREVLVEQKHRKGDYEIDVSSVRGETLEF